MNIKVDHGPIHRGGFGIIHKLELEDGTIVAKKIFSPEKKDRLSSELLEKLRKRFAREVRIQERLSSEFCIPIIDSSLKGENPFFIMPYAQKSYHEEIMKCRVKGIVPEGLGDILNAMEYLHELGYVHRDLKPDNILFHEGKWKLADMGLITADPEFSSEFFTSKDFKAGSGPYMSPEQFTSFHSVTHHADIYSFGAILHDIFDGSQRVPHKKQTTSGNIGVIIEKCTEEDIKRRFKNVATLRNVLLAELANEAQSSNLDESTEIWIDKLQNIESWSRENLDTFIIYLERNEDARDVIFYNITNEVIQYWFHLDFYLWKEFILSYFDWIQSKSFIFDYCDVLVGHIFTAYNISNDIEIKANAILTSANLGASHNRWYVMRYVLDMCKDIPDNLANRINIEIHVGGYRIKQDFLACVKQLEKDINSYPLRIQQALI